MLLLATIILSVTSTRSVEATVTGSVTTDHSQYVVNVEQPTVLANIQGKVDGASSNKVVLTIVKPDGTSDQIQTYVTSTGIFTIPYTLDTSSLQGQYKVTANYQGVDFGTTAFNVVSSNTASNQPSTSSQAQQNSQPQSSTITTPTTTPTITSVTEINSNSHQTISISGSGFGNQSPYSNQDSPYIKISDRTENWNAGNSANPANLVTLNVASWTDSQITINGFGGSYGPNGWSLKYGNIVDIYVWNAQKGTGPATYTTTVGLDKNTVPTVNLSTSTINGLTVTLVGNWNYPNKVSQVTIDWGDSTGIVTINNNSQYTHTYSHIGAYTITLTVYDINGLSGSSTTTVNLQKSSPPTISNLSVTANGMIATLYANVAPSSGNTIDHTTIAWGDGIVTPNGLTSYTHTYSQSGTYTITLTAYDNAGQSNSATTSVTMLANPTMTNPTQSSASNLPQTNPTTNSNPSPSSKNSPQTKPPFAFNGAYANYQITYSIAGNSASIPVSYVINNVDDSSQTFTFAQNFGSYLSVLSLSSVTGNFYNPSPFPVVATQDLNMLNQGNIPQDMQGATVVKDVSISVPAGTFTTDEITLYGSTRWIDENSGLIVQQSGSFLGAVAPSLLSGSMQLEKTNIPTSGSPFGNMLYLIIIPIVAAGGIFFVIKKRKAKTTIQPKINEPVKEKVKENPLNIEKIEKLKKLLDSGLITREDFDEQKRKLLGSFS